jgi:uncharacterized membrane protein SpoIIM required for sporulation/uncharacterized RDD family membrane protein YckC
VRPAELRQQLDIETPEHVAVRLELAGVGSRAAAALVDTLVVVVLLMLLQFAGGATGLWHLGAGLEGWVLAFVILLSFLTFFGYFAAFEALNGGRTPGKQALGIRVVMETGHAVTPTGAIVRNLVRLLDCYFPLLPFLPGLVMVFLHPRNQRLGDLAAGTIVVRDRPVEWGLGPLPQAGAAVPEPVETGPPELSDDEFRLLDQFLARSGQLDVALQVRLATELARRFQDRIPRRTADADDYLTTLHAAEQRKRASRFATRAQAGVAGRTTVTAERFVAGKRDGWAAFHAVATRVERAGVGALAPGEIPAFAARYREVTADLARARTYGVDPRVIEYLERVVSAGHNALYRARGRRRAPLVRYVIRDFPAAVVQSWRQVLAAFLLFAVPAVVGYGLIRGRPELADEVLPPVMVSRAEQAADHQARGIGYGQSPGEELPVIASAIISNNIAVAFWAFVGGMLGGTLTALVLVGNGVSLGMGFGLFVNYHAGAYLATFVAGHGILELTAIFIAGGAGFRLAGALLLPGDLTRGDALVLQGRIAARMVGAVVTLLALAGTIEGLLSASDAPAAFKYAVSASTVALLGLYLWSGSRYVQQSVVEGEHAGGRPA